MIETLVAAVIVALVIGFYRSYLRGNVGRDGQQSFLLHDSGYRGVRGVRRFQAVIGERTAGVFERLGASGPALTTTADYFEGIPLHARRPVTARTMMPEDFTTHDTRHDETLICNGDLVVTGKCVFTGPVKVAGDLFIEGHAAFMRPVVVAGNAHVQGVAAVYAGLITKNELTIDGALVVGENAREGSLTARSIAVNGDLLLNGHADALEIRSDRRERRARPDGPSDRPNSLTALVIVGVGFLLSLPFGQWAMSLGGVACATGAAAIECSYPAVHVPDAAAIAFALVTGSILVGARLLIRQTLAYPFVATLAAVGLVCGLYDVATGHDILEESRIINDTMNVLGSVMLGSFILVLALLRRHRIPPMAVASAVAVSFGAKTLAMLAFAVLRTVADGASEMFLLFVVYAFGAFGAHLMSITVLVQRAIPAARVSAARQRRVVTGGAVEGLRGVAIFAVVLHHYIPSEFFSMSLGKPINAALFVLAGFFFAASLVRIQREADGKGKTTRLALAAMLLRRHSRIWPTLALVVVLYMALGAVDQGALTTQIFTTWPYYLTYTAYIPSWAYESGTFPNHLWTISAQETVIFALVILTAAVGIDRLRALLWPLVVFGVVARLCGILAFFPDHISMALGTPLAVTDLVVLGMLTRFALEQTVARSTLRQRIMLALMAVTLAFVLLPNTNAAFFTLAPLTVALATSFVLVFDADRVRGRGLRRSILATPWLIFLGRLSLPLFLLHPWVNTVIRLGYMQTFGHEIAWWLLFAIGPPLSVLAALILVRSFERPVARLLGQRKRRSAPVTAIAAA